MEQKYLKLINFIRSMYGDDFIPLHEPRFSGNEKKYLNECIDSTFVSSVGKFVDRFEEMICDYTGAKYAVATVNGTSALHTGLLMADVEPGDEVITQALTFIATCNAIKYCQAEPVFVDVGSKTLGLSPSALKSFLDEQTYQKSGFCHNKTTGRRIKAIVPMHTFGHPCEIEDICEICDEHNIIVVEDAAEALGSTYKGKHCGTFGQLGILSFNGNKVITAGGGGCLITNDEQLAKKAKYITTTAKIPHKWEFNHDMIGYNYRMPNLNAALACAQLEVLEEYIFSKRKTAERYSKFCSDNKVEFVTEPEDSQGNYWLNAIICKDRQERDAFLDLANKSGAMTRPIWTLMNELEMFENCQCGDLTNSKYFAERVVNIPSSVIT